MTDTPPELTDTQRIQAQIERMDALLAQGKVAMAKVDEFYMKHGIEHGVGVQTLLGEAVPVRHRIIFARLLADLESIDRHIDELDPRSATPAPVAVGARAIGSRYRI